MKKYPQRVYERTFHWFCAFFAVLWTINVWGHSVQESNEKAKSSQEKIYVTPEQIEVTEEGVLFYDGLREFPILGKTLSYDEKGLFLRPIVPQRGPCGIHNLWCKYCQGCGVLYCPMKCECPFGGGG